MYQQRRALACGDLCGVGWYVWRPGGGVDGEEHVA